MRQQQIALLDILTGQYLIILIGPVSLLFSVLCKTQRKPMETDEIIKRTHRSAVIYIYILLWKVVTIIERWRVDTLNYNRNGKSLLFLKKLKSWDCVNTKEQWSVETLWLYEDPPLPANSTSSVGGKLLVTAAHLPISMFYWAYLCLHSLCLSIC